MFVPNFLRNSTLTVIYSKVNDIAQKPLSAQKAPPCPKPNMTHHGREVTGYPKFSEDIAVGLSTQRTIGTQTEVSTVVDASIQCNIKEPFVSFNKCKSDKKFKFFTGLEVKDFEALFELLGADSVIRYLKMNYQMNTPKKAFLSKLSGKDRLFMFLLRVRRGLPLEELSVIFDIGVAYAGEICYLLTRHVYLTFKAMEDQMFISAVEQHKSKPKVMLPFNNLRVILDGAYFGIQTPSNFHQQGNTFSNYKKTNVAEFIIGVSCQGGTIFCSAGFEGAMSEKDATIKSGLLDRLQKGDGVLADRGFLLTAELQAKGVKLFKPPILGDRTSFTPEEEGLSRACAAARIYVEHAIADIKDNRLLQGTIPSTLVPVLPNLVYIAAYLRNFQPSRINDYTAVADSSTTDHVTSADDPVL